MSEEKKTTKGSFYKKWWFWAPIVVILFICVGAAGANNQENSTQDKSDAEELQYAESPMRDIEKTIRNRVKEKYEEAKITQLLIFDETDNGTDDYSVMVYLNWDRKNKSDTAKEMLKTYSSDLAATVANENKEVNKISIYWRIPYLMENGDQTGNGENYWIYIRKNGGMALEDQNWIYK